MVVQSREYKLLIDHEKFRAAKSAVRTLADELDSTFEPLHWAVMKGKFDEAIRRRIIFHDTPDHTLRRQGYVLRERLDEGLVELTLKCRSEDRYLAAGADVAAGSGLDARKKLEEDIAPPFRVRYSHSATVSLSEKSVSPASLGDAADFFPGLRALIIDGMPCNPATPLTPVNDLRLVESVWTGARIELMLDGKRTKGTLAIILWQRINSDHPAVAELSFRIEVSNEKFNHDLAAQSRNVYAMLQRSDWALPQGMTKTEFVYRDSSWE